MRKRLMSGVGLLPFTMAAVFTAHGPAASAAEPGPARFPFCANRPTGTAAMGASWSGTVHGVRARAYPVKRPFEYGQEVVIRVEAENVSPEPRSLSVFDGPRTVVQGLSEGDPNVGGIPCCVDAWVRMCWNPNWCAASNAWIERGRSIMRRYEVVGLGLLLAGLALTIACEHTAANPARQAATAATGPASSSSASEAQWATLADSIRARAYPISSLFEYGREVVVRVEVENASRKNRELLLYGPEDEALATKTPIQCDGGCQVAAGLPCYLDILAYNRGGSPAQLPQQEPNCKPSGRVVALEAGRKLSFQFTIPRFDRSPVPTGLYFADIRLGLSEGVSHFTPRLPLVVVRVVDTAAVRRALAEVEAASRAGRINGRELEPAMRTLVANPDPAMIPVLLRALEVKDRVETCGDAAFWLALGQFADERIARRALPAATTRPGVVAWSEPVNGLRARAYPAKRPIEYGQDVVVRVEVENASAGARTLSVFGGHKTPVHSPLEPDRIVDGMPCYVDAWRMQAWDIRLPEDAYNHAGSQVITLRPKQTIWFDFVISHLERRRPVPTGLFNAEVRMAVRVAKEEPAILLAVAEDIRVVDSRAVKSAVETLHRAQEGGPRDREAIAAALKVLCENPDPNTIDVLLWVVDHDWKDISRWVDAPERAWPALEQYRDRRVAARSLPEALKRMSAKRDSAASIFRILLTNRQYLTRPDVLKLVEHPRVKDPSFGVNAQGWLVTELFGGVAQEQDVPLLALMMADHYPYGEKKPMMFREVFLRYPETAKPAVRKVLRLGMEPGKYEPWAHSFYVGRVPDILPLMAKLSADLRDEQAVPILEFYGSTKLRDLEGMNATAARCLARIDGPAAMKALRAISSAGLEERAKLGDPVAVDKVLEQAKAIEGTMADDTYESRRLRALVRALGTPQEQNVDAWWYDARPTFVRAFTKKYGFDPDRADATSGKSGEGQAAGHK